MADEKLNAFKKKRTVLRTAVTKFISKLETELNNPDNDENEIEILLEMLNDKFEALKIVDNEIENILDIDELEKELESSEEYREKIIACKFKVKKCLQKLTMINNNESSFAKSSDINEEKNCRHRDTVSVKLPKISIPKFYGQISQWLTFWNSFETAIHNNNQLDEIDKFNYLKAHLCGTALSTIEGFSISSKNYVKAVDLLKDRFARKDVLVNAHMNNLMHISPLKNSNDIRKFRKFFDNCQTQIRSLESLGITTDTFSSLLCPLILKLLPRDLVFDFNKMYDSGEYSIENLLEFLRKQLNALEKSDSSAYQIENPFLSRQSDIRSPLPRRIIRQEVGDYKNDKFRSHEKNKNSIITAAELFDSQIKTEKNSVSCVFCNKNKHKDFSDCEVAMALTYEERKNILRKRGACFRCTSVAHTVKSCKVPVHCRTCGRRHLSIFCTSKINSLDDKGESVKVTENKVLTNKSCSDEVHLQTLIVGVSGKGVKGYLRTLIDTGSQNTYISKYAVKMLKLEKLRTQKIKHGLFGGIETSEIHNRYQLDLSSLDGKCNYQIEAFDQKRICSSIPRIKDDKFIEILESKGIHISDVYQNGNSCLYEENPEEIHLLLGADTAAHLFTERIEHFHGLEIAAFETKLGWTLMGKMKNEKVYSDSSMSVLSLSLHVSNMKLTDLWSLDTLGISNEENRVKADLEEETQNYFTKTIKRDVTGRFEVSLPWVVEPSVLPSNRSIAESAVYKTEKKLIASMNKEKYSDIFDSWESSDVIEQVADEQKDRVHFLPHRPVIKESSETTKIRPVFNASARMKNSPSLNDCLTKGPNLIEIIPRILNQFRKYRIGISSDIEKAFLQIKITEKDRDFLRFFWFDNENKLKIYRHCRVVFGLTSSPFLLVATLKHLLSKVPPHLEETARKLENSFYIDNSLTSLNSVQEVEKFKKESVSLLASGQFNLRCWRSNLPTVMREESDDGGSKVTPVLGLIWNLENDSLMCKVDGNLRAEEPYTKRKVLSIVQKVFDPVGFTAPVLLTAKLILQKTWILKLKWDEELPENLKEQFHRWVKHVGLLSEIEIPRWLNFEAENENKTTLHVFSDASKLAYATCAFLRIETPEGVKIELVNARSRVSPIKELTIPRLELLSCLIGARLAKTITIDLNLEEIKITFWSDSTTALGWIRREQTWGTFVHNRVLEIRKLSNVADWRHVPGTLNPADLPSRGCSFEQLKRSKWWEGPSWLRLPEDTWPQTEDPPDEDRDVVYSDNGTNFLGTSKALAKVDWNKICADAASKKIRWKFNPPTASWWGGWWERLVRMVKELLRRVLGHTSLNYEEMSTILCDCEQVINSRPITYVSEDNTDPSPLTPMMFLQELPSSGIPDIDMIDSKQLSKRAKYRQRIRNDLRYRFRSEYLGQLRQHSLKKRQNHPLCVGDIVLVEDINKRRIHWPLAKVIEIIPGKDNVVRLAKVKTENGTFLRPTQRLFPLEICADNELHQSTVPDTDQREQEHLVVTRAGRIVKTPQRLNL